MLAIYLFRRYSLAAFLFPRSGKQAKGKRSWWGNRRIRENQACFNVLAVGQKYNPRLCVVNCDDCKRAEICNIISHIKGIIYFCIRMLSYVLCLYVSTRVSHIRIGYSAEEGEYAESEYVIYYTYITSITFAFAQYSFFLLQLLFVLISPCVDTNIILSLQYKSTQAFFFQL